MTTPPPQSLLVVRRGEPDLYARLTAMGTREAATVIWDRRPGERRTRERPSAVDRRLADRRMRPPATWATLGFLVVRTRDVSP